MKGLFALGEYLFEYICITLLLMLSFVLVIPFVPMFVGTVSFFKYKQGERRLKDIFTAIKQNWRILITFTLFELLILGVSFLNINYNLSTENVNWFFLLMSYAGLLLGLVILANGSVIILKMHVNFIQLLVNSVTVILGGLANFLVLAFIYGVYLVLGSTSPLLLPFGLYFVCMATYIFVNKNILKLKSMKYHISVQELEKRENPFYESDE